MCARDQVGTRVQKKSNPGPRPSHYTPAEPLDHLSEVIRTAYKLEQASSRYHINSVVLLLQPYQSPVRRDVNPHTGYEDHRTNDKPPPEPLYFVVVLVMRNVPRLDIGVEEIKGERHGGDADRKALFTRGGAAEEAERVDDGAVEVMEEVRREEEERFWIEKVAAEGEEEEGEP